MPEMIVMFAWHSLAAKCSLVCMIIGDNDFIYYACFIMQAIWRLQLCCALCQIKISFNSKVTVTSDYVMLLSPADSIYLPFYCHLLYFWYLYCYHIRWHRLNTVGLNVPYVSVILPKVIILLVQVRLRQKYHAPQLRSAQLRFELMTFRSWTCSWDVHLNHWTIRELYGPTLPYLF